MTSARGSNMMLGLALQSVLAWSLGPGLRGEYAICLIFATITAAIFSLSLDWSSSYYIASKKIEKHKIINFCLLYILGISVILPFVFAQLNATTIPFLKQIPDTVFHTTIYWATSLLAFNICFGLLRGLGLFKLLGFISVLKLAITLFGTVFFIKVQGLDIEAPILANILANIISTGLVLFYLFKGIAWKFGLPTRQSCFELSSYGLRMVGGSVGMIVNLQIITILLSIYASTEEVGYFSLAIALLTQIGTLSDVLNTVLLPRISRSENGRSELVQTSAAWVSLSILTASLLLVFLADIIVPTLFSADFIPSIQLLWILAPGMWLRATSKSISSYFTGTNRPQVITTNTFICIVSNILFFFLLTPLLGLVGAAIANTLANAVSFLHMSLRFKAHTGHSLSGSLLPTTIKLRSIF